MIEVAPGIYKVDPLAATAKAIFEHPRAIICIDPMVQMRMIAGNCRVLRWIERMFKRANGLEFVAEQLQLACGWPYKVASACTAFLCKCRVFGQKTPSGQKCLAILVTCSLKNVVLAGVGIAAESCINDAIGGLCDDVCIVIAGGNGDGLNAENAASPD